MVIRRLIAPSVITLMMIGLWADYLFFRDSPWSAIKFLSIALTILIQIFAPLFDPALYWWVGEIIMPVVMIPCGVILLYISVAKAKVAMSRATPSVDEESVILPALSKALSGRDSDANAEPAPAKVATKTWKLGLVGKLAASFGALSLLFSVAVSVITGTSIVGRFGKRNKAARQCFRRKFERYRVPLCARAGRTGSAQRRRKVWVEQVGCLHLCRRCCWRDCGASAARIAALPAAGFSKIG